MTYRVIFTPEALEQLSALYLHIAQTGTPNTAARYTEGIALFIL